MPKRAKVGRSTGIYQQSGVTLIELLIFVSVAAIIAVASFNGIANLVSGNKIRIEANNLVSALNYARSQAILLNRPISVNSLGRVGGEWTEGLTITEAAEVIRAVPAPAPDLDITYSEGENSLMFNSRGMPATLTAASLDICNDNTVDGVRVNIGRSGRVSQMVIKC